MNTSTVLTRLSSVLCACTILICGCTKESAQVPPASLDEIADATFTINGNIGQGVFVGFNDFGSERIFFLTARHVATYDNLSQSTLNLRIGGKKPMSIRTAKDRWLITDPVYDAAWFELTPEETNALAKANGLRYITLNTPTNTIAGKGIVGTGLWEYERNPTPPVSTTDDIRIALEGNLVAATNRYPQLETPTMHGDLNRTFRRCPTRCFSVTSRRTVHPGESGGAVFIRKQLGDTSYWMLAGLIAGGGNTDDLSATAVVPLDEPAAVMRYGSYKLNEHHELW